MVHRIRALSPLFGLIVLLAGCSPAGQPEPAAGDRPAAPGGIPTPIRLPASDFKQGERLAAGDYGVERIGEVARPSLAPRSVTCAGSDLLEVDTTTQTYVIQMRTYPSWGCEEALNQTRDLSGQDLSTLRVGLTYREGDPGAPGQVNLVWENGTSMLILTEGVYRTG